MLRSKKNLLIVALVTLVLVQAGCILGLAYAYTVTHLQLASARDGVFQTPEQAMRALLETDGVKIEDWEIKYSGPTCFPICSPHMWFVHVAGGGRGGGATFLHTKAGWVHMPDSVHPEFIGLGMLLFGLTP